MDMEKEPTGKESPVPSAQKPSWVSDKGDQRKWNSQFIGILDRDYANSDATISAILRNKRLSERCATRVRSYVDRRGTLWLNGQTKARGIRHRKRLKIAIAGLRETTDLLMDRGNEGWAALLGVLADEFSEELGRCKQAFGTKRRGRDRDHSILYECHSFLESELRRPVTNRTVASLLTAGFEADGNHLKEVVTEEEVRKNLSYFKSKNPLWRNSPDPRLWKLVSDQETK